MPISISARFHATQVLSCKISDADGDITPSDALRTAKELEKRFAESSSSEEHYKALVAAFEPEPQAGTSTGNAASRVPVGETVSRSVFGPHQASKAKEDATRITFGRFCNCMETSIGGSSTIFKSRDPSNGATVALKIASQWIQPHDAYREARILARLGDDDHHILKLLETETLRGEFILVFPYYPLTLADIMGERKPGNLTQILSQVAKALAFVHANGVIHRDVKPANILLKSESGPAYLCDFGTAWALDDHHPDEKADKKVTDVGTTCYRAPETLFGYRAYHTEVDIWAFGCVIAEAETGRPLFEAGDLGTDLQLIFSIFSSLGTPDLEIWPEAKCFPDFSKMHFNEFPARAWEELLPGANPLAVDLVGRMVVYSQQKRALAEQVLQHPYLT